MQTDSIKASPSETVSARDGSKNKILRMFITEVNLLIMAFFGYVGIQGLNDMSIKDSSRYLILNLIILYVIYKFFYIISNRLWVSFAAGGFVWYVMGLVNHYVGETRGVMFLPWDIMAFKTAVDVAGAYAYHLYPQAVLWLLFIILTCIAAFRYHKPFFKGKPFLIYALISFMLCNLLMLGMVKSDRYKEIPDRLYLIERYYRTQGFPVSFFHYSKFLFIEKPQGYSVAQCEQGVEELRVAAALDKIDNADKIHAKNVIVIMNEAFADFKTLGDLPEAENALTHFHGVSENCVTGNLYVPVFGGTTVNSEYEFLTANSIAYQKGCPFSYAVRDERPSIASYLKNLGYTAYGFHPATAVNWNRGKVYPLLGFEKFYSIEDFEGQKIPVINEHPVDDWDVDRLIEMYEQAHSENDKVFIFNVTMQNHSGYEFDYEAETGEAPVDMSAYGEYPQAGNYLALLKKSDEAFEKLRLYFEQVDEPTVIVMFGDHQPRLEDDFSSMVYGLSHEDEFDENDPEYSIKKYATPFVVWANYDIKEERFEMLSANYLQELVQETAGIELTPYNTLLKRLRHKYPVLSVNGCIDANGRFYGADEFPEDEDIRLYRYLEYNNANEKSSQLLWDAFE